MAHGGLKPKECKRSETESKTEREKAERKKKKVLCHEIQKFFIEFYEIFSSCDSGVILLPEVVLLFATSDSHLDASLHCHGTSLILLSCHAGHISENTVFSLKKQLFGVFFFFSF
jgi:hypothetical protein